MNFSNLNLTKPVLRALSELGYETPTPIQAQAIPPALEGRDVLGCAQTGTGKTCAFAVPILIRLNRKPNKKHPIRALVLTPTRELAIQNQDCFVAYGKYLPLRSTVIFGGVGQNPQVEALEKGTDILVATPGRLADLYQQGHIDLTHLEIFVLDEADRMLDMGFIHDVKRILKWLPEEKQTLFFSATMPEEVKALVDGLLHHPARIAVDPVNSTVEAIQQSLFRTDKNKKTKLLTWLLKSRDDPSVLVFTRTKHGANRVARDLERAGITAAAIHGNKSQTARQTALADFKAGKLRVLVATDIAARGLDIEGLSCVVNYNLPDVPATYVHRIGRTGRAGQDGIAFSFCDASELDELKAIEKQLGKAIPELQQHPYPMEEMEVPMTDKKGRRIHPEDMEAREAAQTQSKKRRDKSGQKAKSEAAPAPESPVKKEHAKKEPSAGAIHGSNAARSNTSGKQTQHPKQDTPKGKLSDEPVLKPEEDVGDYSDWVRHRASTRPAGRKPYSEANLDELLALPHFASELGYDQIGKSRSQKKKSAFSGGKIMDSTARMFMKNRPQEEPAPAQKEGPKGKKSAAVRTEAPKKDPSPSSRPSAQTEPEKKPAQKPNRHERRNPVQKSPVPQKAQVEQPAPQGKGRNRHRGGKGGGRPEKTSTQPESGKSLIRPYYLSDKKGNG